MSRYQGSFRLLMVLALACAGRAPAAEYTITQLGGTEATPTGINYAGRIVGMARSGIPSVHAFLYEGGGQLTDLHDTLLRGLPNKGSDTRAFAINAAGDIVGAFEVSPSVHHAFLYHDGALKDLGTLGGDQSVAYAINASGQVVGWSVPEPGSASGNDKYIGVRAFLYEDGRIKDLSRHLTGPLAPFVTLEEATGINDAGLIVANGRDSRVVGLHAYLLKPVEKSP
jgi:probable HAF family extracellular repeat protein